MAASIQTATISQHRGDLPASIEYQGWLESVLIALQAAGSLERLELHPSELSLAALQHIFSFQQLTDLQMYGPLPDKAAATRPVGLQQLRRLRLHAGNMPPRLLADIAQLRALTKLQLIIRGTLCPAVMAGMQALTQLFNLVKLELSCDCSEGGTGALFAPAAFSFPALRKLWLFNSREPLQIAGAHLENATFQFGHRGPEKVLILQGATCIGTTLQQLVDALVPASASFDRLALTECTIDEEALQGLTCLEEVEQLFLEFPQDVAIESLLLSMPRLKDLRILTDSVRDIPECIFQRRGLTRVSLGECGLADLPPGPYLADLLSLDIKETDMLSLPASLTLATQLTELNCRGCYSSPISHEDVETVLLRMPQLRLLTLGPLVDYSCRYRSSHRRQVTAQEEEAALAQLRAAHSQLVVDLGRDPRAEIPPYARRPPR